MARNDHRQRGLEESYMNEAKVIKGLAELGLNVTPKEISPEVQKVLDQIEQYEKEVDKSLDPKLLAKYLG